MLDLPFAEESVKGSGPGATEKVAQPCCRLGILAMVISYIAFANSELIYFLHFEKMLTGASRGHSYSTF